MTKWKLPTQRIKKIRWGRTVSMSKRRKRLLVISLVLLSIIVIAPYAFNADELNITRPLFDHATGTYQVMVAGTPHILEEGDIITVLINELVSLRVTVR
ncbi:MAG: hypothetical protein ACFFER_17905, partial [Candidatus Thorarchaeota archaeon]